MRIEVPRLQKTSQFIMSQKYVTEVCYTIYTYSYWKIWTYLLNQKSWIVTFCKVETAKNHNIVAIFLFGEKGTLL